jgi:hypothetical protein
VDFFVGSSFASFVDGGFDSNSLAAASFFNSGFGAGLAEADLPKRGFLSQGHAATKESSFAEANSATATGNSLCLM